MRSDMHVDSAALHCKPCVGRHLRPTWVFRHGLLLFLRRDRVPVDLPFSAHGCALLEHGLSLYGCILLMLCGTRVLVVLHNPCHVPCAATMSHNSESPSVC